MDLINPDTVTAAVVAVAASPWVYAAVFLLTLLDAFLVVVPSETVLVAPGALALSTGSAVRCDSSARTGRDAPSTVGPPRFC